MATPQTAGFGIAHKLNLHKWVWSF